MRDDIRKLQAIVAELPRGKGKRFPAAVRTEVGRIASELRGEGASWQKIGATLGININSIRRFCDEQTGTFTRVEVIEEESRPVLVSPSGYRIEGLSMVGLTELLARLR